MGCSQGSMFQEADIDAGFMLPHIEHGMAYVTIINRSCKRFTVHNAPA
jgi:hypothetical protein